MFRFRLLGDTGTLRAATCLFTSQPSKSPTTIVQYLSGFKLKFDMSSQDYLLTEFHNLSLLLTLITAINSPDSFSTLKLEAYSKSIEGLDCGSTVMHVMVSILV
jgi:hypothetical protein